MHGRYYYPHAAGVGFSFNPYVWHETIDPKAGVAANLGPAAISFAMNAVIFIGAMWIARRSNAPITGRQGNLPDIDVVPTR